MTTPREDAIANPWQWIHDNGFSWDDVNAIAAILDHVGLDILPALGAEAGRGTDLCPDETVCKNSGHAAYIVHRWLASPETAEALARAYWTMFAENTNRQGVLSMPAWDDLPPAARKPAIADAAAILAAMRETGR